MPGPRTTLPNPRQTDILIPIFGLVGAGKSSFINEVLRAGSKEESLVAVGSSLSSCTMDYEFVVVDQETEKYPSIWGSRVVLIDTPGFDNPDPDYTDIAILRRLSTVLKSLYPRGRAPVHGIVYIHDLAVDGQGSTAARNIECFKNLQVSSESVLSRTVLATSKWHQKSGVDYDKREDELQEKHWKDLIGPKDGRAGAIVRRLGVPGKGGSALDVVHTILENLDGNAGQEMWQVPRPKLGPGDIVILVMGQTGAGRSTFVNAFLRESGGKGMKVGDSGSLVPCTTEVHCSELDLTSSLNCKKSYRVFLVDTPGFNDCDSKKTDSVVLEGILTWLQEWMKPAPSCKAGIVYLQDISVEPSPSFAKVDGVALKQNLNPDVLKQLAFVTTKWEYSANPEYRHREFGNQLAPLEAAGSKVYPFKSDEDAWSMLKCFLPQLEQSKPVDIGKVLAAVRITTQRRPRKRDALTASLLTRLFGLFERFAV